MLPEGRISDKKYPEITMLGTASAMTGKYRNNINTFGNIFFYQ